VWVILGVCVCMRDCVVFDFCVFICHDCTAAFLCEIKLNIKRVLSRGPSAIVVLRGAAVPTHCSRDCMYAKAGVRR